MSPKSTQYVISVGPQVQSRAGTHIKTTVAPKLNIKESRIISDSALKESSKYMATTMTNYNSLHK